MNYINPRVDIAFKKIFGVEENKDLLISLVNSIVSPADQVEDLTLLNPYNPQNFKDEKLSILDIKARGVDGKRFNIEIQITDEADYDKRALYYWGKLYTEQLRTSSTYSELSKAIGIHILNFISIPESNKYHNVFHIKEKDDDFVYFKDLELHTIELKKFSSKEEDLSDFVGKIRNSLDMWVAFLIRHDLLQPEALPPILDNAKLKKAIDVLEIMNFNYIEQQAYEDHLKWLWIEANAIRRAETKGEEQGVVKGIVQGRAEGKAEAQITIAKNMLKDGVSPDMVAKYSGLAVEELVEL